LPTVFIFAYPDWVIPIGRVNISPDPYSPARLYEPMRT
jgi:hypothetical protein